MLTLVATPIGNLDDISKRALNTLQTCDAILAEDTRRTSQLLHHFQIQKPLLSYHKFNEKESLERILSDLRGGKHLALVSDAGTPCINDPGWTLVHACMEQKIPFTAIPGPCSIIQALVLSGMKTERFQFIGFLPRKPKGALQEAIAFPGTTIAFESPERLIETLSCAETIDPLMDLAVLREMTKLFEECRRGTPKTLFDHFKSHPPRGEIVMVIAGGKIDRNMPLDALIEMLQELHGLSLKEAIKMAAKITKTPKSDIYKEVHGT